MPEKGFCSDLDPTDVIWPLLLPLLENTVDRDGINSPCELHHSIVHVHFTKVSGEREEKMFKWLHYYNHTLQEQNQPEIVFPNHSLTS